MTLVDIIRKIAIAGGLFNVSTIWIEGDSTSIFLMILGVIFSILAASPYIVVYNQAPAYARSRPAAKMFLAATMTAIAFSVWAYWVTFVINTRSDAQDGIVLALSPIYQLMGIGVSILIADFIAKRWQ